MLRVILQVVVGLFMLIGLLHYSDNNSLEATGNLLSTIFWLFILLICAPFIMKAFRGVKTMSEVSTRKREGTADLSNMHFIETIIEKALSKIEDNGRIEGLDIQFMSDMSENGINTYAFKIVTPQLEIFEEQTGQFYGIIANCNADVDAGVSLSFCRAKNGVDRQISEMRSASVAQLAYFIARETRSVVRQVNSKIEAKAA